MNLLCKCTGSTVDAGIMDAAKHKHLVVWLVAQTAVFAYLVAHFEVITIKC